MTTRHDARVTATPSTPTVEVVAHNYTLRIEVNYGVENDESNAAADNFLATLPKYVKANRGTCSDCGVDYTSAYVEVGWAATSGNSNNERGAKRARRFWQALEEQGLTDNVLSMKPEDMRGYSITEISSSKSFQEYINNRLV